jgi:hypothetical protein
MVAEAINGRLHPVRGLTIWVISERAAHARFTFKRPNLKKNRLAIYEFSSAP